MSVKLFVEGGGNRAMLKRQCRKGFREFIKKAGAGGRMPRIVASGSRQQAYDDFKMEHALGNGNAILLVDAEAPVSSAGPWEHLGQRDHWHRPRGATDGQCHLMVQVMESWFLADSNVFETFYGQGFRAHALPRNPAIEKVSKCDVMSQLKQATRVTQKGSYNKGSHSFAILEILDPNKVASASPYAKRFLRAMLGSNA